MSWPNNQSPFGVNHTPVLLGIASDGSKNADGTFVTVPVAVDKATGAVVTEGGGGGSGGTNGNLYVGQQTSNTSAVQLTASSEALSNGVIVQALSTNTASVFIGGSGVTTATGFELQPGQATSVAISNLDLLYVIGSDNTDKVTWIGN